MAKHIVYTLSILFLSIAGLAQDIANDSMVIRNFGSRDYKAALFNFSACEDENGIIYIANDNGVLEYDGSEWRLIRIKDYSAAVTLKLSPDGKIYVGGVNEFGYLERNSFGQFEYKSLKHLVDSTVNLNEVWQVILLKNEVYFQSYESIIKYDGETANIINVTDSWLLPINDEIHFATYDKGISRIENDSITYINKDFKLKEDAPFKLLPGPDGMKLMLTEFNGIFLLDTATYSIEKWDVEANERIIKYGLYDGMVWDDSTYLFSNTTNGAMWVSKEGKTLRVISKDDGLSSNMTEIFRDSKGTLWLPGNGINVLTMPNNQHINNFKTLLRYVEVNDSSVYVNTTDGILSTNDHTSSLVFHFATPGYDKSDLEYSYYLEGYENSWSSWRNDVKKEYTNLENGEYAFHVKARLSNGETSTSASIGFNIPILWYNSFWAYFFAIIIITVLVWVGLRLRMAHLKTLNERLEKIIGNRTQELQNQKEQLRSANEELTVANSELDNFVYRSSHDLIAPLKSLNGLINIAKNEKSEEALQSYFDMMNSSVDRLEEFIKSILEYSSNAKGVFEQSDVNLNSLLDSVVDDLKYFEQAEKVELKRHFEKDISFITDPKRLKIIISNIIANAVKYHNYNQPNPHIEVTAIKDSEYITISIIDNGQGIDAQRIDKIFDMFYRASENSQGSGLGLYIVKDTVHKLGGQIDVKSKISKGTTFSLKFKLN